MVKDKRKKRNEGIFAVVNEVWLTDTKWIDVAVQIDDSCLGDRASTHEQRLRKRYVWRSVSWLEISIISLFLAEQLHLDLLLAFHLLFNLIIINNTKIKLSIDDKRF